MSILRLFLLILLSVTWRSSNLATAASATTTTAKPKAPKQTHATGNLADVGKTGAQQDGADSTIHDTNHSSLFNAR